MMAKWEEMMGSSVKRELCFVTRGSDSDSDFSVGHENRYLFFITTSMDVMSFLREKYKQKISF